MTRIGFIVLLSALAVAPIAPAAAQDLLWKRQFGTPVNDGAFGVAVDSAGNVYITGLTWGDLGGPIAGKNDAFLAKYDASGAPLWTRQLGTSVHDLGRGVAVDNAGNVYITGNTEGSLGGPHAGGQDDPFLAKYDTSGTLLWTRQIGTGLPDWVNGVAVDSAGNAYITGHTNGSLGGPSAGSVDAFLAKFDASGNLLWTRQTGTAEGDFANGVAVDSAGSAYITGSTEGSFGGPNAGDDDAFLAKYDASGVLLWKRQAGTQGWDGGIGVAVDSAGNAYITGSTGGSLGGPQLGGGDFFLAKFGCYADCDQSTGNGVLDMLDFLCFQNSFVLGAPYACDCDPDPAYNFFDFLCFQNAFVAGCP